MGDAVVKREYDLLGRVFRYTDADGAGTVNEFDRFGKPSKITDPAGSTSYAYDRSAEPRGLLTSVTDSSVGTFAVKYAPDGQLVEMKYPGGLTRTDRQNASRETVERTYTRDADGAVVFSESLVENSAGHRVDHEYTGGSKSYSYDRLGRLTRTRHDTAITSGCVTRTYQYDARANRLNQSSFDPAADGSCDPAGADASAGHTYDSADRLTDAGYVYDEFGRTLRTPDDMANDYFVNDLIRRQQVNDARQTWTLDPAMRFRSFVTETEVDSAWATTASKINHYGDETDEPRWIVEDATGTVTRNLSGPDGDLVAMTTAGEVRLQLTNVHGDVAVTVDPALSEPELYDYDEFGVPSTAQSVQRYGWLGGKQRSGEALGGSLLMGVRLYQPATGRFLSADPVAGGSCNAYEYVCGDPVNSDDLDGRRCRTWKWTWTSACRPSGSYREALHAHIALAAWVVPGGAVFKGARFGGRMARMGWKARKRVTRRGFNSCRSNWRACGRGAGKNIWAASIGGDWDNAKTAGKFWRDRSHDWVAKPVNIVCRQLDIYSRGASRRGCPGMRVRRFWRW